MPSINPPVKAIVLPIDFNPKNIPKSAPVPVPRMTQATLKNKISFIIINMKETGYLLSFARSILREILIGLDKIKETVVFFKNFKQDYADGRNDHELAKRHPGHRFQ